MANAKSIELLGTEAVEAAARLMNLLACMEELSKPYGPSWPGPLAHWAWEAAEAVMAYEQAVKARLEASS